MFDSLGSKNEEINLKLLAQFLSAEYKNKKNVDRDFSYLLQNTIYCQVPQQKNLIDCGIFLLQFAESFCEVILVFNIMYRYYY